VVVTVVAEDNIIGFDFQDADQKFVVAGFGFEFVRLVKADRDTPYSDRRAYRNRRLNRSLLRPICSDKRLKKNVFLV
jgi:hypothetical protein